MSIVIRGNKFHYRFQIGGKRYTGPCAVPPIPEKATAKEIAALRKLAVAAEAEAKQKKEAELNELAEAEREIRKNKSVVALVENYKFELTGGARIALKDAYPLAVAKPSAREAKSSFAKTRESYFNDFVAFMEATFPDVTDLSMVRRSHCEMYVKHLSEHGRFVRDIQYNITVGKKRKKQKTVSYTTEKKIAPKTIKTVVGVCHWVFRKLAEDAGIYRDPWEGVVLPKGETIDREIFTPEELQKIWDGMQSDPFCYPLFLVAANSGMTEGDICTLEWSEIDWSANCIRRDRRKTGADIVLPLLPQLAGYLSSLPQDGRYVFPEHAEMYLDTRRRCGVSSRVIKFLHSLGIETTRKVPGRRAVSVKDLHSMRHLFCYMAAQAGIPRSSIAKMVGHIDERMTAHYAAHETAADLNAQVRKLKMPFVGGAEEPIFDSIQQEKRVRRQLAELAYSLPEDTVRQLVEYANSLTEPETSLRQLWSV